MLALLGLRTPKGIISFVRSLEAFSDNGGNFNEAWKYISGKDITISNLGE